jgi:hypothetical protein
MYAHDFLSRKKCSPCFSHASLLINILQGCTTDDPIIPLYQYEDYLQSGIRSASFFLANVKEVGIVDMNDACGAERTPLIEGITLINNNLELLSNALR